MRAILHRKQRGHQLNPVPEILDADVEAIHTLAQGRKAWLQVARGEVRLGEEMLKAGDAAAITDQSEIAVRSNAASELLLFDLA